MNPAAFLIYRSANCASKMYRLYSPKSDIPMKIKALFFASCRDIVGNREMDLDVAEGAYYRDYLDDRKTYVTAMMKELNWARIEERFKKAEKISKVLK